MTSLTRKKSGIYSITNKLNSYIYIGSAVYIGGRWSNHKKHLNKNAHINGRLQNAWNKYGADCFVFSVIEYCEKERLLEREQSHMDTIRPEYNIRKVAGSNTGLKYSQAAKDKMSAAKMGKKKSPEHRLKIIAGLTGHIVSAETRAKISASEKGKTVSPETSAKILATKARKGSSKGTGRKKGFTVSQEIRDRISATLKGIPKSKELRMKLSIARKNWWAKKKRGGE